MDLEMLKLALAAKGFPPEMLDAGVEKMADFLAHLDDFLESGADMHRAQEAAALMAAATNAHALGQPSLAAAFIEHAEWLVSNGQEDEEETPTAASSEGPSA
jgi:hypothetical protein